MVQHTQIFLDFLVGLGNTITTIFTILAFLWFAGYVIWRFFHFRISIFVFLDPIIKVSGVFLISASIGARFADFLFDKYLSAFSGFRYPLLAIFASLGATMGFWLWYKFRTADFES